MASSSGDIGSFAPLCPFDNQEHDSKAYTVDRELTPAEMEFLRQLDDDRRRFLINKIIGDAGEQRVLAWLKSTKCFADLTHLDDLGQVKTPDGEHAIDIAATDRNTGDRYALSVKNWRSWMLLGAPSLKEVVKKAARHDRYTWARSGCASEERIVAVGRPTCARTNT